MLKRIQMNKYHIIGGLIGMAYSLSMAFFFFKVLS
jgi:uncharacterized membrane protein